MTETRKNVILLVLIALLVALGYGFVITRNTLQNERADNARTALAYAALDAKIEKRIKDGVATYSKPAPEITVDDILNSPAFKNMSAEQRKYYQSLQTDKRQLIASVQAKLAKHDTVYVSAPVKESAGSSDSTVSFKRNTVVAFQDTSKALKWNASITLNNPLAYHMRYTYDPVITTTFKRNKDRSTLVEYSIDDPQMEVKSIQSIVIPLADQEHNTAVGKWLYNNRKVLRAVGAGVVFSGGVIVGAKL